MSLLFPCPGSLHIWFLPPPLALEASQCHCCHSAGDRMPRSHPPRLSSWDAPTPHQPPGEQLSLKGTVGREAEREEARPKVTPHERQGPSPPARPLPLATLAWLGRCQAPTYRQISKEGSWPGGPGGPHPSAGRESSRLCVTSPLPCFCPGQHLWRPPRSAP